MPADMIFIREGEIFNAEEMALYQAGNRDAGPSHGIKPLVVYGKMEALEGDAPYGMVMLEFPDSASAKAWYRDPDYQARSEHRKRAADYRAILVEGWAPLT